MSQSESKDINRISSDEVSHEAKNKNGSWMEIERWKEKRFGFVQLVRPLGRQEV